MKYTYKYPRAALTVDAVVFGVDDVSGLQVLLIKRKDDPFKNCWALPGGFLDMGETTDEAVARELEEETSLKNIYLEQLYTFSGVDRDPRERVVSVAYYGLVKPAKLKPVAGSDAKEVCWFNVNSLPSLAFDHSAVIAKGLERLRGKLSYQPIGFELLPPKFSLGQLQAIYEIILGHLLDASNFRKKILSLDVLKELEEQTKGEPGRPAKLYRFDARKYKAKVAEGFSFELKPQVPRKKAVA